MLLKADAACPAAVHSLAHSVEVQAAHIANPASNIQEAKGGDLQATTIAHNTSTQRQPHA